MRQDFQAFSIGFQGTADRIITDISVAPAFDPKNPPTPPPEHTPARALWDTGATRSVLSSRIARALQLTPVGTTQINHAGGISNSPTYMVNFKLPNQVGVAGVIATEFPETHDRFDVIVGMDVICLGDFSITNVGRNTLMSFRTPSCAAIDYVLDANKVRFSGVGRNEPCPCGKQKSDGSRLKFKHCHGASVMRV